MPVEARPIRERLVELRLSRYSDDFFSAFKDQIPLKMWDRAAKVWLIPERYIGDLEELADQHGVGFYLHEGPAAAPPPVPGPYDVLGLTPKATPAVIKAAHKALALEHHPDRGGNVVLMQQINAAFDRIRRERGF